jgi:hypothetical protein
VCTIYAVNTLMCNVLNLTERFYHRAEREEEFGDKPAPGDVRGRGKD